jgi:hypothetical protein
VRGRQERTADNEVGGVHVIVTLSLTSRHRGRRCSPNRRPLVQTALFYRLRAIFSHVLFIFVLLTPIHVWATREAHRVEHVCWYGAIHVFDNCGTVLQS